jgi:septal ring factor EnvC (AmiA/AmiB activator)
VHHFKLWLLLLILYWGLALPALAKIAPLATPSNPQQLQTTLTALQQEITHIQQQLNAKQVKAAKMLNALANIEQEIGSLHEQLRELDAQILTQTQQQQSLQQRLEQTSVSEHALQQGIIKSLQLRVYQQQQTPLQYLLHPQTLTQQAKLTVHYDYAIHAQQKQLINLTQRLIQLKSTQQQLSQHTSALTGLKAQVQTRLAALANQQLQRKQCLTELNAELQHNTTKFNHLTQQAQDLAAMLGPLRKKLAQLPSASPEQRPLSAQAGKLTLPIPLAQLTNLATWRNATLPHSVYLDAAQGTPVYAIYPGRVVFAQWLRGLGLLLIIDHGHEFMSLYGNNEWLYPKLGEWVEAQQLIARVGNSGGRSQPGLYFEIRKNGQPFNAASWFKIR